MARVRASTTSAWDASSGRQLRLKAFELTGTDRFGPVPQLLDERCDLTGRAHGDEPLELLADDLAHGIDFAAALGQATFDEGAQIVHVEQHDSRQCARTRVDVTRYGYVDDDQTADGRGRS